MYQVVKIQNLLADHWSRFLVLGASLSTCITEFYGDPLYLLMFTLTVFMFSLFYCHLGDSILFLFVFEDISSRPVDIKYSLSSSLNSSTAKKYSILFGRSYNSSLQFTLILDCFSSLISVLNLFCHSLIFSSFLCE